MKRQIVSGLGVDLVEVARIERLATRNPRFLTKFFTPRELAGCLKNRNKYERLAARFAVKEAVVKALDAKSLNLRDIEVKNTASGRPQVRIGKRSGAALMVSISHTAGYALAAAVAFAEIK